MAIRRKKCRKCGRSALVMHLYLVGLFFTTSASKSFLRVILALSSFSKILLYFFQNAIPCTVTGIDLKSDTEISFATRLVKQSFKVHGRLLLYVHPFLNL